MPKLNKLGLGFLALLLVCSLLRAAGGVERGSESVTAGAEVGGELDGEPGLEPEEVSGEEEEADQNDSTKFTYKIHPEDHGIYSGRALMSRASVDSNPRPELIEEELEPLKTTDYVEKEWQLMFRAYDQTFTTLTDSLVDQIAKKTSIFEDVIHRLPKECKREIFHIRNSIKKHKLWALRMLDSTGKPLSGMTYGRFSTPGDFKECLSVKLDEVIHKKVGKALVPEHHKFNGKYCLLDFRLPLPERPKDKILSVYEPVLNLKDTEIAKQFPAIMNFSAYASVLYEVGYMHGICIPDVCDIQDLVHSIGKAVEGLHLNVTNQVDCQTENETTFSSWTRAQVISATLLGLVFLNALAASLMHYSLPQRIKAHKEYLERDEPTGRKSTEAQTSHLRPGLRRWLTAKAIENRSYTDCFSIQKNFERLTKPDPRGLTFVHYTRIVAMALTVITHTAGMGTLQAVTKPADTTNTEQMFRDFLPQMLANAFSSIQIFFFMAGFMLVLSTYPTIKRDPKKLSFVEFAIKRAIRLMPGLAAAIAINFLWPLFVDGPMLNFFIRIIVKPCETTWWRTMAFLSNYDHVDKMCLRHSYFSASDYQLHIMAFPLLILLAKNPVASLSIAALLTGLGFAAQIIMILTKPVLPFMMIDYLDKEAFLNVVHFIHHPVWNHMSAFFYGFIVGYAVVKKIRINLSERGIKRIWYTIIPAGVISIFAPYYWNHYKRPIEKWHMIVYVLVDRFTLLTTCAWLSYASLVLGRTKPKQQKPRVTTNLPDIVAIDQSNKTLPVIELDKPTTAQALAEPDSLVPPEKYTLKSRLSVSSLTRQTSTPDFLLLKPAEPTSGAPIKSSVSTGNVNLATSGSEPEDSPHRQQAVAAAEQQETNAEPRSKAAAAGAKPPVSNINTLCLVFSRLTFQLYLFNMVVLWIDVNHSQYYWFFSYYFIITKAFAIYIFSSIIAMTFFVTLESPCLTLYIMWVKKRTEAQEARKCESAAHTSGKSGEAPTKEWPGADESQLPASKNHHQHHHQPGLQMRNIAPPTFSYIDLSGPNESTKM